jgi:hypothetical protein
MVNSCCSNGIDCKYCHHPQSKQACWYTFLKSFVWTVIKVLLKFLITGTADYSLPHDRKLRELYEAVGWDVTTQKHTGKKTKSSSGLNNLPDSTLITQHVTVAGWVSKNAMVKFKPMKFKKQSRSVNYMDGVLIATVKRKLKWKVTPTMIKIHTETHMV